jgi:hypothetical protein
MGFPWGCPSGADWSMERKNSKIPFRIKPKEEKGPFGAFFILQ